MGQRTADREDGGWWEEPWGRAERGALELLSTALQGILRESSKAGWLQKRSCKESKLRQDKLILRHMTN